MHIRPVLLASLVSLTPFTAHAEDSSSVCPRNLNNSLFRNMIIANVENAAGISTVLSTYNISKLDKCLENHYQQSAWTMRLSCYQKGKVVGSSKTVGKSIDKVIAQTVEDIKGQDVDVKNCQFKCDFSYYPDRHYSFIDYKQQGLELAGNRVAVRRVTVDLLEKQIKDSIGYLRMVQHPKLNGFFKFYDAGKDKHEPRLRTIYSSSSLYTYMLAQKRFPDLKLEQHFKPIAQFILSQQIKDGPEKGAYYYSYELKEQKPKQRIVVGTASKTIFTLLELNKYFPKEPQYLQSAVAAGDWLVKQTGDDGRVTSFKVYKGDKWVANNKQSLLYSGQVLSALSRLYLVVPNQDYFNKAQNIAKRFLQEIQTSDSLLGDEYRPANLISTSWVMRSLMDFYMAQQTSSAQQETKVENKYLQAIQKLAKDINKLQIKNLQDISYAGKFSDSMTASGNGWLNEVFGDYYHFCKQNHLENCDDILQASILSTRYLLQNAYRRDNSYNIANPQFALGAFALRYSSHMVRTDSVCHGVNSFIYLLNNLPPHDEVLLDIPEQSIQTLLPLIKGGNKKVSKVTGGQQVAFNR